MPNVIKDQPSASPTSPLQAIHSHAETKEYPIRTNWTHEEITALYTMPFMDLIFEAQKAHRVFHNPNAVQLSQLKSIKTGGCAEDCGYCSQSAKFAKSTGLKATKILAVEQVLADAQRAKKAGATRYCMGAAWTSPKDRDMGYVIDMVKGVKALGLETCVTLGMLSQEQTADLKKAGLDYYNHNIDTSEDYYEKIITTRTYQDRLDTLKSVREAGINVCSGGIVGMGETQDDRVSMIRTLATLEKHPESVPINLLVRVKGTPLENANPLDPIDFIRTLAVARITMPASMVRLSAGREKMSEEMQALAFLAGANSIFYGDQLLTAPNPENNDDLKLIAKLGMTPFC